MSDTYPNEKVFTPIPFQSQNDRDHKIEVLEMVLLKVFKACKTPENTIHQHMDEAFHEINRVLPVERRKVLEEKIAKRKLQDLKIAVNDCDRLVASINFDALMATPVMVAAVLRAARSVVDSDQP